MRPRTRPAIAPRLDGANAALLVFQIGTELGVCRVVGVDFEEVVEDDEEHGAAAEEDGERVQVVVGYHFGGVRLWMGEGWKTRIRSRGSGTDSDRLTEGRKRRDISGVDRERQGRRSRLPVWKLFVETIVGDEDSLELSRGSRRVYGWSQQV